MTITALGSMSVGVAVPGCSAAVAAGIAGINGALPDILARLEALAAFAPQPIDFAAQLTVAQGIVASVQSAITLGLPVPSIAAQIAAVTALVTELTAQVVSVNAQLTVCTNLQAPLLAAGVNAYAYAGNVSLFGAELAAELGLSGADCNALVLLTTIPATWTAMGAILKVS